MYCNQPATTYWEGARERGEGRLALQHCRSSLPVGGGGSEGSSVRFREPNSDSITQKKVKLEISIENCCDVRQERRVAAAAATGEEEDKSV